MTENDFENRANNLKELSLLISNGDESLSDDVRLSEQNPNAYFNVHRAELENRGISKPETGLSWIALVDGMEKKGKLIELDWKESGEEIIQAVLKLSDNDENIKQIRERLERIQPRNFSKTLNLIERINQELKFFDRTLIMIDIYSDCYPITVIQLSGKTLVIELANRVEAGRIHTF